MGLLFIDADVVAPGSFFYYILSNLVPVPYKLAFYEKMTSQPTSAAMKSRPTSPWEDDTYIDG